MDIVRVQETELSGSTDPDILAWAAAAGRVLLSHDASTMTDAAYARIARTDTMPGVIIIPQWLPVSAAVDLILVQCSVVEDWTDQVRFLPLA